MKSPGGRDYRFSVRNTQRNLNLLQNKKEMDIYLSELKQQGLKPLGNQNNENENGTGTANTASSIAQTGCKRQGGRNANTASSIAQTSGEGQGSRNASATSALSGTSKSLQHAKDSLGDSDGSDDYIIEEEEAPGSKRHHPEHQTDSPVSKRAKAELKTTQSKGSTKKLKELRVQHCVKGEKKIFEVERTLLEEVLQRPPLFDWRMDHKQRAPDLLFALRLEVAEILNETFDITLPTEAVDNTFNFYRALYVQFSNAVKSLPSGSGSNRLPKEPKHYEVLKQLDFLYERREQFSSTSDTGFVLKPPQGRGKGKGSGRGKGKEPGMWMDRKMMSMNYLRTRTNS